MSRPTLETLLQESGLAEQIERHKKQQAHEEEQRRLSLEARKKRAAITQEILEEFSKAFPEVMGKIRKPLKIGIKEDILAYFKNSPYSKNQLSMALKYHLNSYYYYNAMLEHKKRFDLLGNVVEDIAEEHLAYAEKQVAFLKSKFEKARSLKTNQKNRLKTPRNGSAPKSRKNSFKRDSL